MKNQLLQQIEDRLPPRPPAAKSEIEFACGWCGYFAWLKTAARSGEEINLCRYCYELRLMQRDGKIKDYEIAEAIDELKRSVKI